MQNSYIIQIILSIISFFILINVYQYLDDLKECSCFVENQHPDYKINIDFLKFYQILEIITLFIFIVFISMYKSTLFKGGSGGKKGMRFFVILSTLVFLFITGYVSYSSILLYFMSKKDCMCVNKWQKYIIYIQGTFNTIYFLRIIFTLLFVFLLLSFMMKK